MIGLLGEFGALLPYRCSAEPELIVCCRNVTQACCEAPTPQQVSCSSVSTSLMVAKADFPPMCLQGAAYTIKWESDMSSSSGTSGASQD